MSEHDESKLPKWARDRMDRLRREAEDWKRAVDELRGRYADDVNEPFRLQIGRRANPDRGSLLDLPLGRYTVSLQTPHGYRIDVGERDNRVEARVIEDTGRGIHALRLVPQASNSVFLDAGRLHD